MLKLSACVLWWSLLSTALSVTVHLYVSPTGNDSNDGRTTAHPVKTLQHAASLLGGLAGSGNTVYVELMQGYHDLSATLHLQNLAGTVIFRAYQGQEVHVTGGQRLSSSQFHHVTDSHVQQRLPQAARSKVLEIDLTAAGITDMGTLVPFGFAITWNAPLEIFINGNPLTLAEWPNLNFINILSVPNGPHGRMFTYDAAGRDALWTQEAEPWAYGWWYWGWADEAVPIQQVDSSSHTITLKTDTIFDGLRVGHYDPSMQNSQADYSNQGGYFRVVNMLCELDQPGEYYIDRAHKKLYVWPNTAQQTLTSSDVVYASMIDDCIRIENTAQNVHFEDISLEACRHFGFFLNNAHNVTIQNLEIKNTGGHGVHCDGDCRGVQVVASEIHDVGGGVSMSGGDRTHLTSSENVIRDNAIWNHARVGAQPNDACHIDGVHITVAHNHIHHGQYTGIRWTGNDHVIEYNHIHHECWNSSDCGAIHSGRDWTWRGNVIRHNHIHDVQRHHPGADNRGIMLDDEYSAVLIEHNVFYDNDVHANIGGGRDNIIRYNIMYNALSYAIQVDGRGLESWGHSSYMRPNLDRSPYRSDLWKARYPELYSILDNGHPEAPEGNQIYDNVFWNPSGIQRVYYGGSNLDRTDYFDVHDNLRAISKSDFWSPNNQDFRLQCEALQWGNTHQFPVPDTISQVGPTVPTGPNYLRASRQPVTAQATAGPAACNTATVAPATHAPKGSYMPDGTTANTLYSTIPHQGCWFIIDHCPSHPTAEGTHQDDIGTQAGTEQGCLSRAGPQWQWCGSPSNGRVVAVYGPTGAMTFGAFGCYFAEWGCTSDHEGYIHRDDWAEQHENASVSEAACLRRASPQWQYCGSSADRPFTSIYGPTGNFVTAGAGCWLKITSCPADHTLEGYFFDAWGDTNLLTGTDRSECFDRATYFWTKCGSHSNAPVTAFYRPDGASHTVP